MDGKQNNNRSRSKGPRMADLMFRHEEAYNIEICRYVLLLVVG